MSVGYHKINRLHPMIHTLLDIAMP